jgi:hypothetical protein
MFGVGNPRRNPDYMDNLPFVKGNCDFGLNWPGNCHLPLHIPVLPRHKILPVMSILSRVFSRFPETRFIVFFRHSIYPGMPIISL